MSRTPGRRARLGYGSPMRPTSKAALKTFTQHLRMELAPFGIEVTNLEPGGVDTAMTETGPEAGAQQWAG
jgi:NAD(P)-dependent dehydrogenase (short-subunit alcohol dehydrogenase family)